MKVFNESYLKEIVETQGDLFEDVREYAPGIDVRDFIIHYMNGKTRELVDEGQAYLCTMDAKELFSYFMKHDMYQIKSGTEIGGFLPNWIGQFYAYFQWIYQIPSREVMCRVPLEFLISGYAGLHDLDMELAVKKVGERCEGNGLFS